MRRWLLILMVAIIPLRAWAGDAMALSTFGSLAASQVVAAPCHRGNPADAAVNPATMSQHGAGHNAQADAGPADGSSLHNGCTVCDICNGPAMAHTMAGLQAPWHVAPHVEPFIERFASAEAQRAEKPPIA